MSTLWSQHLIKSFISTAVQDKCLAACTQRFYWQEWLTEKTPAYQNEPFVDINVINKIIHKFLNWCGRWSVVLIFSPTITYTHEVPTPWLDVDPYCHLLSAIWISDEKYCLRIILNANWKCHLRRIGHPHPIPSEFQFSKNNYLLYFLIIS